MLLSRITIAAMLIFIIAGCSLPRASYIDPQHNVHRKNHKYYGPGPSVPAPVGNPTRARYPG